MANTYPVQPGVEVHIEAVGGDLVVEGRSEAEIKVRGDNPDVRIENNGAEAAISCGGDCRLRVPQDAKLTINSVGGDARITDVTGEIHIETVAADLVIRDTGPVHIESIGADLELKRIGGDVEIGTIGADASFRELTADLRVNTIASDALISDVRGGCEIDTIGADLVLDVAFDPAHTYRIGTVGGDVLARVRPEADVQFKVPHHVHQAVDFRGATIESHGDLDTITLGSGAVEVQIESIGGEMMLASPTKEFSASFDINLDNLDEVINEHLSEQLGNLDEIINSQISEQLAGVRRQAEHAAQRAREKAERIAEKARRNAERMQHEAERNAERARRRHQRGHGWNFDFTWPQFEKRKNPWSEKAKRETGTTTTPGEPVTNEERLMILRMVENKQISVEEAERLLAALEGLE